MFCWKKRIAYEAIEDELAPMIECEELKCQGYKPSTWKACVFHVLSIAFGGIPYLFIYWNKHMSAYVKYSRCCASQATVLLISDFQSQHVLVPVLTCWIKWPSGSEKQIRYFYHRHLKFVWDDVIQNFKVLTGLNDKQTFLSHLLDNSHGLTIEEQEHLLQLYGPNTIAVETKSYWQLFVEEVFNPFYIFQIFSVLLWSFDEYYIYAGCVVALSALSVTMSLIQTRRQNVALSQLVAASNVSTVTVKRKNGDIAQISASCVVPGDIIVIPPHGCIMACDALLLSGNCIVNESMLTGESVPVTKTPPAHADQVYDADSHKRHTLFCGTQVLQTRYYGNNQVLAVVVRTGFMTSKGELIRSILFPKPMGFKFYQDAVKFVLVLFVVAAIGMGYCIYLYVKRDANFTRIILRTLDIITIVVPPALPAAMTAGTVYSQNRLKKLGIFCISPPRINVCGKIKLVCFDKTGTLTEEGLDLWGVIPCFNTQFNNEPVQDPTTLPVTLPIISAMASCHSLTRIDGVLTGDPLDLSMFESTQWELEEPGSDICRYDMLAPTIVRPNKPMQIEPNYILESADDELPYEIGIIRQFPFSSSVQCMSVITRTLGSDHMALYCKGAPEKLISICKSDTVPLDFPSLLTYYTSTGYRVIALAYRNLDPKFSWRQAQRAKREQMEDDLEFLGLLIMQNTLKTETIPVIHQLQRAKLRCVMVTGDNILTAVSVARDCGMVQPSEPVLHLNVIPTSGDNRPGLVVEQLGIAADNTVSSSTTTTTSNNSTTPSLNNCYSTLSLDENWHFAVDGRTWNSIRAFYPDLIPQIITKGTIFARMAPDQKSQLVEALQDLDYVVAMCGDGANDCGALRAADIGVSLSEAEASVAAPFTSHQANIKCIVHLVKEGRCALVTSFGLFKYMALYSLIQFITILILYVYGSILGNNQFLFIDLVITTTLALGMGRTGPSKILFDRRPMGSLVSPSNVIPLLLHVALTTIIQCGTIILLKQGDWIKPINLSDDEEHVICWENTALFCVSCYQYLILAAVYSKGLPHRMPFYKNGFFMVTLISLAILTTVLLLVPAKPLSDLFEVMPVSAEPGELPMRLSLLMLAIIHLFAALFVENCIANRRWLKVLLHWITRKHGPKNRYKQVWYSMSTNNSWLSELIS